MADWLPPFWAETSFSLLYQELGQYVDGVWVNGPIGIPLLNGVILDRPQDTLVQDVDGNQVNRIIDVYIKFSVFDEYKNFIKKNMFIVHKNEFYKVLSIAARDKVLPHYKLTCQCVDRSDVDEIAQPGGGGGLE